MDLRKEFEEETKDQLYYWFQEYSGASMEEHGFSEEYVEWLEAKVKKFPIHSIVKRLNWMVEEMDKAKPLSQSFNNLNERHSQLLEAKKILDKEGLLIY